MDLRNFHPLYALPPMKPATDPFYCPLDATYSLLSIQGDDAKTFLQGQVTCDVAEITANQTRIGAVCNPKGRALTTFRLVDRDNGYLMMLPNELCASISKRLRMYVLRSKVSIDDVTEDWHLVGLSGKACEIATADAQALAADASQSTAQSISIRLPGPQQRLLWLVERKDTRAIQELSEFCEAPIEHWQLKMIEDGVPQLTSTTQELFVPQMLNLDVLGGISFKKGCYTGQEIVARMHYLGKLKKRTYLFRSSQPLEPGSRLFSESDASNSAGTVVNCAADPSGGYLLLAVCQINTAHAALLFPENSSTFIESVPLPYELPGDG